MPIRFRCKHCRKLLSITSRKAGQTVRCPACREEISVPRLQDIPAAPPSSSVAGEQRAQAKPSAEESPEVEESRGPASLPSEEAVSSAPFEPAEPPAPAVAADTPSVPPEASSVPETPAPASRTLVRQRVRADDDEEEEEEFQLRRADTEVQEMDLTPMVDVTFLLLIFFMITASFSLQKSLQFPPPDPDEKGVSQSLTLQDLETDSIIVEIDEKNTIIIDDEPLDDPAALVTRLQDKMRSEQKTELVLQAHAQALHEFVVMVVDAANEVGMQKIRLATSAAD